MSRSENLKFSRRGGYLVECKRSNGQVFHCSKVDILFVCILSEFDVVDISTLVFSASGDRITFVHLLAYFCSQTQYN